MSRIRSSPAWAVDWIVGLGFSFTGYDRPSGVSDCRMSGLDRPIDAPVHFSTLIDGAAEFCKLSTDVVEHQRQP